MPEVLAGARGLHIAGVLHGEQYLLLASLPKVNTCSLLHPNAPILPVLCQALPIHPDRMTFLHMASL